jgi:hypothetical protein
MKRLSGIVVALLLGAGPQDDLKSKFEAKRAADPVEAFKLLAASPGEAAQVIARPAIAKQLTEDLAAGLKAFGEGKADQVEKPFVRAALLAESYCPQLSSQLMRIVFLTKQARKTVVSCALCKGAGAAPCTACQAGFALGNCPRCEAKGNVPCLLCDGSGTLDHPGYKGTFVLTMNDTTVVVPQGKGTLHGQIVTYHMSGCTAGSFHLKTDNVITCAHKNDPKRPVKPTSFDGSKPCGDFWKEMKMFAFNGRAKMQVNNNKGQLTAISPAAARRFFSEYESCAAGRVSCDRCTGKKTDVCSLCTGKGQAPLMCAKCEGSAMIPCAACKGYGDATWIGRMLPPPTAPALAQALAERAATLREWFDERARRDSRLKDLTTRFADAKKDLDPTAKLTDDTVDIVCPKCKGGGKDCEECWNAGRREYSVGTSQFERYAIAQRLERQLKDLEKGPAPVPVLPHVPELEAAVVAKPVTPLPPPNPSDPAIALAIPKTIEDMIKKADELHETGKSHLEKSKASSDNAVWQDEAVAALKDLKNAQILYTTAQEALDAKGAQVPRSLLDKYRTNMQALVMARKQAP